MTRTFTEGVAAMVLRRVVRWWVLLGPGLRSGIRALGGTVEIRCVWVVVLDGPVLLELAVVQGLWVICSCYQSSSVG